MRKILASISRLALAGAFVISATACGNNTSSELLGYVPTTPQSSAGITVTEQPSGTPFELKAQPNEVLIVYFGYTNCPDVCPTTLVAIKNAKKKIAELADRVDIAMITVDPERDTAEILPKYLSSFTSRFHALIPANDQELRTAEKAFDAVSSVTKVDGVVKVTHGGTAYIVDSAGTVIDQFPFGLDAKSMANDLTVLLNERTQTK